MAAVLDGQLAPSKATLNARSTDEEIDAYVLSHCDPAHHISGTCRMGAVDDPMSVCDEEGKVIGVDGLRVVDCSLMPCAQQRPHLCPCCMCCPPPCAADRSVVCFVAGTA